jgi:hypothetical protein
MKEHKLSLKDFEVDEIEEIELIGEGLTVDIEVEDTHMFFANNIYSHNSSAEQDIIEADKVSDSFGKIMDADFIMSWSRKTTDKMTGTGRAHIVKNRFGPDGITLPGKMNGFNGDIKIYMKTSAQGKETHEMMKNGNEAVRKSLSQKLKDLNITTGEEKEEKDEE